MGGGVESYRGFLVAAQAREWSRSVCRFQAHGLVATMTSRRWSRSSALPALHIPFATPLRFRPIGKRQQAQTGSGLAANPGEAVSQEKQTTNRRVTADCAAPGSPACPSMRGETKCS